MVKPQGAIRPIFELLVNVLIYNNVFNAKRKFLVDINYVPRSELNKGIKAQVGSKM